MKKLLVCLAICLIPALVYGAGTATFTKGGLVNGVREYKWDCIATDATGAVSGGQTDAIDGFIVGAYLYPVSPFSDTDWALQLLDANSFNWLFTAYTSNSTTVKVLCPLDANMMLPRLQGQRLTISASGMSTTPANTHFIFYLYVREQ